MYLISVDGGILYFRPMEIHFKPNHYLIVSSDDRMLVSWGTGVDKCEQTPIHQCKVGVYRPQCPANIG